MSQDSTNSLTRRTRIIILVASALVAVLLDQATKVYATKHWQNALPMSFFGDILRIDYAENHGAFLSLLANMPETVRFWILTVANGAVLAGLAIYLLTAKSISTMTFVPLLLVVVGGLGNLIDRIRFGYVIDFLNMGIGGLRTGIFNVADMAITAGFILMVFPLFRKDQTAHPPSDVAAGQTDDSPEKLQNTARVS